MAGLAGDPVTVTVGHGEAALVAEIANDAPMGRKVARAAEFAERVPTAGEAVWAAEIAKRVPTARKVVRAAGIAERVPTAYEVGRGRVERAGHRGATSFTPTPRTVCR